MGPYVDATTTPKPSLLFIKRAATKCLPVHVLARSNKSSFHANIIPPDLPEAAMATCASPLPQPRDVQICWSTRVSIVSWRRIISAPHSRKYRPMMPRHLASRSPCTFQLMHFMEVPTKLHSQPPSDGPHPLLVEVVRTLG